MDLIATHLKSGDSLQFTAAKGAFSYYEFDKKDEKALSKLLNRSYLDDAKEYNVKNNIIEAIVNLKGPKTLKTFTSFYKSDKATNSNKVKILRVLPALENDKASTTFFELLKKNAPIRKENESFGVFSGFNTKPQLVLDNMEQFISLMGEDNYRDKVLDMIVHLIKTDSVNAPKLKKSTEQMLSYFEKDALKYIDTLERKKSQHLNYGLISDYLYLADIQESPSLSTSNALVVLANDTSNNTWFKIRALILAIEKNIEVSVSSLNKRLDDKFSRYEIMQALIKNDQKDRVPKKYLEKKNFAELSLYNYTSSDYDYFPNEIKYVGDLTHEDLPYLVYTFNYEDEETTYLGVVKNDEIDFEAFEQYNVYVNWNEYDTESDWQEEAITILNEE